MENTVENTNITAPADDALEMPVVEEEQDASEPLESVLEDEPQADAAPAAEEPAPASEPGWIKKRVDKAVAKAVAEAEARVSAQYEALFAPMRAQMLENEAKDLVRQGEFKSLERAKEYLQLKQGQPVQEQQKKEQARDEQGRFAPQQTESQVKAEMLAKQAQKIMATRDIDLMDAFNNNDEYKDKILSGEWDFYDLAAELDAKKQTKRSTPKPMRSPNGATGSEKSSISTMSDEQFARLDKNISEGRRYSI